MPYICLCISLPFSWPPSPGIYWQFQKWSLVQADTKSKRELPDPVQIPNVIPRGSKHAVNIKSIESQWEFCCQFQRCMTKSHGYYYNSSKLKSKTSLKNIYIHMLLLLLLTIDHLKHIAVNRKWLEQVFMHMHLHLLNFYRATESNYIILSPKLK